MKLLIFLFPLFLLAKPSARDSFPGGPEAYQADFLLRCETRCKGKSNIVFMSIGPEVCRCKTKNWNGYPVEDVLEDGINRTFK